MAGVKSSVPGGFSPPLAGGWPGVKGGPTAPLAIPPGWRVEVAKLRHRSGTSQPTQPPPAAVLRGAGAEAAVQPVQEPPQVVHSGGVRAVSPAPLHEPDASIAPRAPAGVEPQPEVEERTRRKARRS
jgi:hypothetical protein